MDIMSARNFQKVVVGDPFQINFIEKWLFDLNESIKLPLQQAFKKHNIDVEDVKSGKIDLTLIVREGNTPAREEIYQVNGIDLIKVDYFGTHINVDTF
jgi:hypothetical protein